jgi:glycosyltransferase involved in cell wall biosynthesis
MMIACFDLAKDDSDTEVIFLSRSEEITPPSSFKSVFVGERPQWIERVKDAGVDVVIPIRDQMVFDVDLPFVGWFPDFQHLRLPELFDPEDLRSRDQLFSAIAQKASVILLSSESARLDFDEFFPDQAGKARVARFPSLLWALDRGDDSAALSKYHLPQKFALVANQFWRHKNHRILPPALGLLKRRGVEMNLVVTGLPSDYRDPENRSLSEFFQESAKEDVVEYLHFLGEIPYRDLVAVMRAAALIIQPSFFEGWSTSIEDCKALGRPLVCSDIPVHREQVPDALGFFDPEKSETLADLLAGVYEDLPAGPDLQREEASFALARERASEYGRDLVEMTKEAAVLHEQERVAATLMRLESLLKETNASTRRELESLLKETNASTRRELESLLKETNASTRRELESLLKEIAASSEQQGKYIRALEARINELEGRPWNRIYSRIAGRTTK